MSDRVDAYASAMLTVAQAEGVVERVEDELFKVARTVEGSDPLRSTLTDPAIPVERRAGVVDELLGKRALPLTTAITSFIVGAGRAHDLPAIVDAFVARAAEARAEAVAEVRTDPSMTVSPTRATMPPRTVGSMMTLTVTRLPVARPRASARRACWSASSG